jgi:hypothetical protein
MVVDLSDGQAVGSALIKITCSDADKRGGAGRRLDVLYEALDLSRPEDGFGLAAPRWLPRRRSS